MRVMCKEDDAMEPETIKISHLSKSFGDVKAVNDLSFQVKKGELFAFLGVNEAGKSTTILVNGLALILCYRHYRPSADDTGTAFGVGNIVSAGYGFLCGAYMPISNFDIGLQKVLSYLPSTYGTCLLKNHMLRGIIEEVEKQNLPEKMIAAVKDTLDCNPQFRRHVVSMEQMIMVMVGSIVLLGVLYLWLTSLWENREIISAFLRFYESTGYNSSDKTAFIRWIGVTSPETIEPQK